MYVSFLFQKSLINFNEHRSMKIIKCFYNNNSFHNFSKIQSWEKLIISLIPEWMDNAISIKFGTEKCFNWSNLIISSGCFIVIIISVLSHVLDANILLKLNIYYVKNKNKWQGFISNIKLHFFISPFQHSSDSASKTLF